MPRKQHGVAEVLQGALPALAGVVQQLPEQFRRPTAGAFGLRQEPLYLLEAGPRRCTPRQRKIADNRQFVADTSRQHPYALELLDLPDGLIQPASLGEVTDDLDAPPHPCAGASARPMTA